MAPATRRKVIGGGGGKGGKGGKRKGDVGLPDELEEDVDRYVDGRNRLMMGGGEDASEEEEEERELVMGVGGGAPDSDDEEFVDSSDDEDGVKTGKHLEGIMSDDEDEKTKLEEQGWGKDKSDYYDRDEMSDTEDEEEEEKEAKRIRAKQSEGLKSTDFGEDDVVASDEEEEEEDDTLATKSKGKRSVTKKIISLKTGKKKVMAKAGGDDDDDEAEEEKIERDLTGLSVEERMEILANSAPELKSLVADMKRYLGEIRTQLMPLKERCELGQVASESGGAYVDCKLRLLTSYCNCVAFYLLLKSEGKVAKSHPVIDQLVELRSHIEEIGPLDEQLADEIELLLQTPAEGGAPVRSGGGDDDDDDDEEEEEEDSMDSDEEDFENMDFDSLAAELGKRVPTVGGGEGGKKKAGKKGKSAVGKAAKVEEMRDEFMDEEEDEEDELSDDEEEEEEEEESEEEEEVPKKRKRKAGAGMQTEDDYGDKDEAVDKDEDQFSIKFGKKRTLRQFITQKDQAKQARIQNYKEASGEVDVPIRDWRSEVQKVNERKSRILAKAAEAEHKREEEMEKGGQIVGEAYEKNDYYEAVKAAKEKKKEAKKEAKKPKLMDYVPEPTVQDGEKRTASNMIVKNRGLVPHRSKEKKNPRVKHRKKFEKAKVKERTSFYGKQTRDDRGGYGGETTGIKAHISRSRKF